MPGNYQIIAAGSGWGAVNMGTSCGPGYILKAESYPSHLPISFFDELSSQAWFTDYHLDHKHNDNLPTTGIEGNLRISEALKVYSHHFSQVSRSLKNASKPIIIGGDHSLAIPTWSAVAAHHHKPFGIIWIDAHLDAHTFDTSPSNGLFGMPVAALLGYGDNRLTSLGSKNAKILPQNIAYIGTREFESAEKKLIDRLNIKIFTPEDVNKNGFEVIFKQAKDWVTRDRDTFGISLDVDAFDPSFAPGTGAAVPEGLKKEDVIKSFSGIMKDKNLLAFEIVEFNPKLDRNNVTANLVWEIIYSLCGGKT